eukprot:scaffold69932_cov52-Attheya_sp.AAC.4
MTDTGLPVDKGILVSSPPGIVVVCQGSSTGVASVGKMSRRGVAPRSNVAFGRSLVLVGSRSKHGALHGLKEGFAFASSLLAIAHVGKGALPFPAVIAIAIAIASGASE